MKYCTDCGTQMADDAVFCEECGAKQDSFLHDNQQSFSMPNAPQVKKNKLKALIPVVVIIILIALIISLIKSCSTPESLEDVSSEFAEALLIDFDAEKAVSLMSDDLVDAYLEQMNFRSEDELIEILDESFKIMKEDTIAYYGDDWTAEIIDVKIDEVEDGFAVVIVSISHEGSDALWNTNIDELWVYLMDEEDGWRVYGFEN